MTETEQETIAEDQLITLRDAAEHVVCGMTLSYYQLRQAILSGRLACKRIDQTMYVTLGWVRAWLLTPDSEPVQQRAEAMPVARPQTTSTVATSGKRRGRPRKG